MKFYLNNPVKNNVKTITEIKTDNNVNTYCFFNIFKNIRILGLMSLISYMIVVLFTWIFANMNGFAYFSAGEPDLFIKYTEWILGIIGILVAAYYLLKELKTY